MILFAIDPGPKTSGVVRYDTVAQRVIDANGSVPNLDVLVTMCDAAEIVCETIEPQGRGRTGITTRDTTRWYGRFEENAHQHTIPFHGLARASITAHLYPSCPSPMPRSADARIRAALIVRFGTAAMKRVPTHAQSALALAVTFADRYGSI